MLKTWVVVAESGRARIFTIVNQVSPLEEIDSIVDTAARAYERDQVSDRPGRSFDSFGRGRHAMEVEVNPKHQAAIQFAKELSDRLELARIESKYEAIVLIASPAFLGVLRQGLGENTKKCITKTISKNLVRNTEGTIREYLF